MIQAEVGDSQGNCNTPRLTKKLDWQSTKFKFKTKKLFVVNRKMSTLTGTVTFTIGNDAGRNEQARIHQPSKACAVAMSDK
jgi:hypothetical protein